MPAARRCLPGREVLCNLRASRSTNGRKNDSLIVQDSWRTASAQFEGTPFSSPKTSAPVVSRPAFSKYLRGIGTGKRKPFAMHIKVAYDALLWCWVAATFQWGVQKGRGFVGRLVMNQRSMNGKDKQSGG